MESYVRPGLLLISIGALLFVIFTFIEDWLRKRRDTDQVSHFADQSLQTEFTFDAPADSLEISSSVNAREPGIARQSVQNVPAASTSANIGEGKDPLIVIYVMAKPGEFFASYDLLQAIAAAGLEFGRMNIFHYYGPVAAYAENSRVASGAKPLFSLASVAEPGEFHIDEMGDFSCPGLVLFMQPVKLEHPGKVFVTMLETARLLAEDLEGELGVSPKIPWTDEVTQNCFAIIRGETQGAFA